ncbi:MAG: hypothetical protein IKQ43_10285 [Treponema sp.]|nr:hypothetical protein [Treponema sp.]
MIILTEKPSVAKDIATGLGGYSFSKTKRWWEKDGNSCIVSAAGHLLELYMPEDYDEKYRKWNLSDLPILPENFRTKPKEDTKKVLDIIALAFKTFGTDDFILATDADREGELIGALILEYLKFDDYERARRFWVSEALTPEVVKKGIADAKPLSSFAMYRKSGSARSKADWLIGMNITRLLTGSTHHLLHFGRVQTAVLGAIYLRDKNIAAFKSAPYWQFRLKMSHQGQDFYMFLTSGGKRDFYELEAPELQKAGNLTGKLEIKEVKQEKKSELPPLLYSLTALQKECSTRLHISPEETLSIVQKLYEEYKCMSYPRTSSSYLGDDNVELFRKTFRILSSAYPLESKGCDENLIDSSNKRLFNSEKIQGHHALIPLSPIPAEATQKEKDVYNIVLERFFQTVMKEYLYMQTMITGEKDGLSFTASGRTVTRWGWKKKVEEGEEKDDDENQSLPDLKSGDLVEIVGNELLEKKTKPKKHFTNASLLSLMENPKDENSDGKKLAGLGTPATRASIISELIHHQYVRQEKQNLLITELGCFLIETVIDIPDLRNLISIGTTTMWEQQLQDAPDEFLYGITKFIRENLPKISITQKWVKPEKESLGTCPICKKGRIIAGKSNYYCSEYKTGCQFKIWQTVSGALVSQTDVKALLSGKKTGQKTMKNKDGKVFKAALSLEDGKLKFVFSKKN